jgi:hypothetical protein
VPSPAVEAGYVSPKSWIPQVFGLQASRLRRLLDLGGLSRHPVDLDRHPAGNPELSLVPALSTGCVPSWSRVPHRADDDRVPTIPKKFIYRPGTWVLQIVRRIRQAPGLETGAGEGAARTDVS